MFTHGVVLVPPLALDAKEVSSQESREGVTPEIMFTHFDENDFFVCRRSLKDELVHVIHGKDDATIVGEMLLELSKLLDPTWTFQNPRVSM